MTGTRGLLSFLEVNKTLLRLDQMECEWIADVKIPDAIAHAGFSMRFPKDVP